MSLILSGSDGLSDVDGTAAAPAIRGTDTNTGIFFGTDIIGFSEGGVESARFNSSGNLQTIGTISVGNATPSTSGAGITFPATQSASTDANTLDDYEEGTFTVSLVPSSSGSITLKTTDNLNKGYYTKIGKSVTINGKVQADSVSSPNGFVTIQGLPFASDSTTNHAYACSVFLNSTVSANVGLFSIYMNEGATQLLLVKNDGTTQQLNSAQQFQASTILYFSATYFVS